MSIRRQVATAVPGARSSRESGVSPVGGSISLVRAPGHVASWQGQTGGEARESSISHRAAERVHDVGGLSQTWPLLSMASTVEASPAPTPLPLAPLLAPARLAWAYYAVTAVDDRGRMGDATAMRVLQWRPGLSVTFSVLPGAAGVVIKPGEGEALTGKGRLRVPVPVRRALRIEPGDRVLVAAYPERDVIVAYTMPALDAMTSWFVGSVSHGATA